MPDPYTIELLRDPGEDVAEAVLPDSRRFEINMESFPREFSELLGKLGFKTEKAELISDCVYNFGIVLYYPETDTFENL